MVKSSTERRGLSNNASKGIDVSETHQCFQLDNVCGIADPQETLVSKGSGVTEGYTGVQREPIGPIPLHLLLNTVRPTVCRICIR